MNTASKPFAPFACLTASALILLCLGQRPITYAAPSPPSVDSYPG